MGNWEASGKYGPSVIRCISIWLTARLIRYRGDDRREPASNNPNDAKVPLPPSAIYDSLTTNIPHTIMAYHDHPFPAETFLYPPASVVQSYLLSYADRFELRKYVKLNHRVERAIWDGGHWRVHVSDGGNAMEVLCDHLIVGNGHYSKPYVPDIPGLKEWESESAQRRVSHSMWYREPSGFAGKGVLVIGGGPSGSDISAEAAGVAEVTYHSVRGFLRDDATNPKKRSEPVSFDAVDGAVIYADGSRDLGIEEVILGTGYEFK